MSTATTAADTSAARLRAPSWRDPKLLLGLLLVLVPVVAGGRLVAAADDSVAVWAARETLASGDVVAPGALTAVRVRLDDAVAPYLSAEQPLPEDLVALRTLGPGELVPASAVGRADELARSPLGLPYEGQLPSGLVKGSRVDVWVTPSATAGAGGAAGGVDGAPRRLASRVEVAEVSADDGALTAGAPTTVQVHLSEEEVALALAARAADADIALLLVPGTTPGGR